MLCSESIGGEKTSPVLKRTCRRIPLSELTEATNKFSESFIIGKGGFALVYGGQLDSIPVAIKRPKHNSPEFRRDFEKEISMVSEFRHRNLVPLIGYCDELDEMILIYEYMDGGTLEDCLHKNPKTPLTWIECLKLITCAGRAVDYLHTGNGDEVIHRDIKSSNILLDLERTIAKISDFGISKIQPDPNNGLSTRIQGTPGYLDPVYFSTGELTVKSDVFSFGVVMFEILSGRKAVERLLPKEKQNLSSWAKSCVDQGKVRDLIDPRLKSEISASSLSEFVKIAVKCLNLDPDLRPTMTTVVGNLELALKKQLESSGGSSSKGYFSNQLKKTFKNFPYFSRSPKMKMLESESAEVGECSTSDAPNEIENELTIEFVPRNVLTEVTDNFSENVLIGEGPKEKLYRGIFTGGQTLFIRRLGSISTNDLSDKDFLARVSLMSKLQHENVVQLVSYCVDGDVRFLNYEFSSNGSVYDRLHGQNGAILDHFLSWNQRFKIATGTSSGLAYLHEGGPHSNPTVHCEITSRNIILFDDFVPKISDFNLPSQVPDIAARPRSDHFLLFTLEDYANEFGIIEEQMRNDTYNFGVFLLELLTGRKPRDHRLPFAEHYLVKWILEFTNQATTQLTGDKLKQCMDPRLQGHFSLRQAENMAEVAISCLHDDPANRPSMKTVTQKLRGITSLNLSKRADSLVDYYQ